MPRSTQRSLPRVRGSTVGDEPLSIRVTSFCDSKELCHQEVRNLIIRNKLNHTCIVKPLEEHGEVGSADMRGGTRGWPVRGNSSQLLRVEEAGTRFIGQKLLRCEGTRCSRLRQSDTLRRDTKVRERGVTGESGAGAIRGRKRDLGSTTKG